MNLLIANGNRLIQVQFVLIGNINIKNQSLDLSHGEVTLRKLVMVNDLTICLDKRNASGKIEVYQEPILYRCSMAIRFYRNYFAPLIHKTSTTRINMYCTKLVDQLNFSLQILNYCFLVWNLV